MSDYQLNKLLDAGTSAEGQSASKDDRSKLRFFQNVRKRGSKLTKAHAFATEQAILDRVHTDGAYAEARNWYESRLWDFLARPDMQPRDYAAYITEECGKRGWFRATPREASTFQAFITNEEVGFVPGMTPSYSAMLHHLSLLPGLDGITLLCALFREAYGEFEITLAASIRSTLNKTLARYAKELPMPPGLVHCFTLLVEDRIVVNRWFTEKDIPRGSVYKQPKMEKTALRLVEWYTSPELRPPRASIMPIVMNTQQLTWMRQQAPHMHKPLAFRLGVKKLWLDMRDSDNPPKPRRMPRPPLIEKTDSLKHFEPEIAPHTTSLAMRDPYYNQHACHIEPYNSPRQEKTRRARVFKSMACENLGDELKSRSKGEARQLIAEEARRLAAREAERTPGFEQAGRSRQRARFGSLGVANVISQGHDGRLPSGDRRIPELPEPAGRERSMVPAVAGWHDERK